MSCGKCFVAVAVMTIALSSAQSMFCSFGSHFAMWRYACGM